MASALKLVPFQDSERSKVHLQHAFAQVSPSVASTLPGLLAETPDPDSAVLLFDRFLSECGREISAEFDRHNALAHYAIAIFGHSRYLGETLLRNPELLSSWLRDKSLERSFSREEFHEHLARFRSRSWDSDVSLLLARFKRRQYVRIMLRDLLKFASLAETTAEISSLSDVLIEDALRVAESELQRRSGTAQHLDTAQRLVNTPFAVLSLGKLGGNELNYNSDIDLLFLYGDGEQSADSLISNHEYFVRLAQKITDLLGRITEEGPVFRIDLRLRPQGTQGELAVNLGQCLHYYSAVAQDWERQALIKARHSAGDATLAREFLRGVQAHVYNPQVNFSAIKTALLAREKMHSKRRLAGGVQGRDGIDVKLDPGGIRDIEFLVQCLQRVYGGAEPWLRSSGTLFALHKLYDKRHLSGKEFHDLSTGYEFLRRVEHCLQLRHGRQTHRLPEDKRELHILQRAVSNFLQAEKRLENITATIQTRMTAVAEIYRRVIYQQQSSVNSQAAEGTDFRLYPPECSDQQLLQRLATDAPDVYALTRRVELHPEARKNLLRFASSAFTSSDKYGILLRNSGAVERGLRIFESSDYLTEVLVRHPEEIATLANLPRETIGMGMGRLFSEAFGQPTLTSDPVLAYVAASDATHDEKLSILRKHHRQREFASGVRDLLEGREVYESLAHTTAAAEEAIAAAFSIAGSPPGLAVLALGRLGTREFDLLSDADLLFVADEEHDRGALTKAAELIMHALAAYTREGMLFPVDPRLRPHGSDGELITTPKHLHAYFAEEAQVWEALTYTKLRPIVGDRRVARSAISATGSLFERFSSLPEFKAAVREMRSKLEVSSDQNFKTAPGGTYDIDFLAAYWLIVDRAQEKNGSLRDRLWRCAEAGRLTNQDATVMDHAAEFLRTVEHVIRLVTGRAAKWLPARVHTLERCQHLTFEALRRSSSRGLETELNDTLQQVRSVYARVLG